ncbi:MAG: hypothetical protein COC01_02795 [Bacteroidetes bacterium]|nr:MAG: hypothetical protein COC01_02795 [Bacteroidota bacterium]
MDFVHRPALRNFDHELGKHRIQIIENSNIEPNTKTKPTPIISSLISEGVREVVAESKKNQSKKKYYNGKRKKNIFDPKSKDTFKLSRTKIDLFLKCPRCFYIDIRLGLKVPPGYPFTLNVAVDELLKREFDFYRKKKKPHPIMIKNGIHVIPFLHPELDTWRHNFKGMRYHHPGTNLILYGAVDDVWVNPDTLKNRNPEIIIVDYKATSKKDGVSIDEDWQIAYKRQMEFYQWLFRKNRFKVSKTGYFVYCNGIKDKEMFDNRLEFDLELFSYKGNCNWVEKAIIEADACLRNAKPPKHSKDCHHCLYIRDRKSLVTESSSNRK